MFIKQLSVFLENREGRLEQVLETLKSNSINIISLSLADTSDYGMLRMIVSDGEKGKKALKENGFSAKLTDVLAVKLENKVGSLQEFLKEVHKSDINIEYMYALSVGSGKASMVIKPSNLEKAAELVKDSCIMFMDEKDLENI